MFWTVGQSVDNTLRVSETFLSDLIHKINELSTKFESIKGGMISIQDTSDDNSKTMSHMMNFQQFEKIIDGRNSKM